MALLLFAQACTVSQREAGIGAPVDWEELDEWHADRHAEAWQALLRSCERLRQEPQWQDACDAAAALEAPSDRQVRDFIEAYFRPHPVFDEEGGHRGLVTGYYEPLLDGSFERDERYRYPLHAPPPDLLRVELGAAHPELADRSLRGHLVGKRVLPYPERRELVDGDGPLAGSELLWVDDPVDKFFLQVQGSGRIKMADGSAVAVGFADHNGRPYRSIGRRLIETGELAREAVNLFSIRRWIRSHPERADALLNHNPRYVFFELRADAGSGPVGALGVVLSPGRSIAVDTDKIPLGAPVWLETNMPDAPDTGLARLVLAQDTGGAIKGWNRADVFWGHGESAERLAGLMSEPGRLYVILPRPR